MFLWVAYLCLGALRDLDDIWGECRPDQGRNRHITKVQCGSFVLIGSKMFTNNDWVDWKRLNEQDKENVPLDFENSAYCSSNSTQNTTIADDSMNSWRRTFRETPNKTYAKSTYLNGFSDGSSTSGYESTSPIKQSPELISRDFLIYNDVFGSTFPSLLSQIPSFNYSPMSSFSDNLAMTSADFFAQGLLPFFPFHREILILLYTQISTQRRGQITSKNMKTFDMTLRWTGWRWTQISISFHPTAPHQSQFEEVHQCQIEGNYRNYSSNNNKCRWFRLSGWITSVQWITENNRKSSSRTKTLCKTWVKWNCQSHVMSSTIFCLNSIALRFLQKQRPGREDFPNSHRERCQRSSSVSGVAALQMPNLWCRWRQSTYNKVLSQETDRYTRGSHSNAE